MIVYGDPSNQATLTSLSDRLRSRREGLPLGALLDDLRSLLIEAGQLEQAVHDAVLDEALAPCARITDGLASVFVSRWQSTESVELLSFDELPSGEEWLTVKVPEGFAFYGLYPEGYAVAARRWLDSVRPAGQVAVIGIRSIGTTLSAVVLAALRAEGVPAHRFTVRPGGHPYARQVEITPSLLHRADWALIVDEGPGQSGSSMASVAEAVHRAGIPHDRIVFLPGHGGEPGGQASEEVKSWWSSTPRFFTPIEELRWKGRTLEVTLAATTGEVVATREVSGGAWRELVFLDPTGWPAVALPFERRKILMTRSDGSKVLWKFTGLQNGRLGFTSAPWIEGPPLRREDATPELLSQVGRHIVYVAGPPLVANEAEAARKRLEDVLYWNTLESPWPTVKRTAPDCGPLPSYGDGRMAPYEWRRLPGGKVVKVPRVASTLDHTIVGPQPIAWDIAGAVVEWGLDEATAAPLLAELPPIASEVLRFYCLAYAAFRMGTCAMFAGMSDDSEASRLKRDEAFYREAILRLA
jgi:hypothetical protein